MSRAIFLKQASELKVGDMIYFEVGWPRASVTNVRFHNGSEMGISLRFPVGAEEHIVVNRGDLIVVYRQ